MFRSVKSELFSATSLLYLLDRLQWSSMLYKRLAGATQVRAQLTHSPDESQSLT